MNRDIAIIGMAGRFPDARNLDQLFQQLSSGTDSIGPITAERLRRTTLPPDREYHRRGYLADIDCFDHELFTISLAEAREMDPHQRLLLEVAYETFENAGYSLDAIDGSNTGVYVADCQLHYHELIDEPSPTVMTGNTAEFMATRLNRFFNLTGSVALFDTSCSSSLVALHHACNELLLADVAQALVCGVNLELFPFKEGTLDPGVNSPDGTSRPFSAHANGMAYGEAVACVLLKPLANALTDGDLIHAVIKSTAVNNNARRSASLTAPDSIAQAEVIRRAWAKANVPLRQVRYVEAHGSGTQLGDILEVGGLNKAFEAEGVGPQQCQLSTIKANIGHARSAAGMAGLIKAVLSLKKQVLFPSRDADQPNPHIDFSGGATYLNGTCRPWQTQPGEVRYCGVSSIGFSGTNCHVALQEAPAQPPHPPHPAAPHLLLVSGHSPDALTRNLHALLDYSDKLTTNELPAVEHTLAIGRKQYRYRRALVADSPDTLRDAIREALQQPATYPVQPVAKLFFVMGDSDTVSGADIEQYSGAFPAFAAAYSDCLAALDSPEAASPLVTGFMFQYAYYRLLETHGLTSPHLLGVGSGKLLTAVLAGSISLPDGLAQMSRYVPNADPTLPERLLALLKTETATGNVLFLEMGAPTYLAPLLTNNPQHGRAHTLLVPTGDTPRQHITNLLGQLYEIGYQANWSEYARSISAHRTELPTYQFSPTRCWARETPPARFFANAIPEVVVISLIVEPDSTETELMVAGFWKDVLEPSTFSRYDNFFEVGGDSLKATRVINRIREVFGVTIHFEDVFDYPTLDTLSAYIDQQGSTQQKVARIWQDVLQRAEIGSDDDFFELGAHSLMANQVLNRIRRTYGVNLNFEDIFRYPTARQLGTYIDSLLTKAQPLSAPAQLAPLPPAEYYDVSYGQKRLWVMSQFTDASVAYNTPVAFSLTGQLDRAAFRRAIDALIERHEVLRTSFILTDEGPKQRIHPPDDNHSQLIYKDLQGQDDEAARALMLDTIQQPFDLTQGSLLRVHLMQLGPTEHRLLLVMHHIVSDGWSFTVFLKEFTQLYNAFRVGQPNPLPPLAFHYKEYAHWLNGWLNDDRLAEHRAFWQGQFADNVPVLELPLSYPRPLEKTYNGARVEVVLDQSVRDGLYRLNQQHGSSLFMTLLATLNTFLYRYTSQDDIVVGYPVAGRELLELENQLGFYANTLPVRTRFDGQESFGQLLSRVKQRTLDAQKHHLYPFDRLVDDLQLVRDASHSPLFDVVLVLENAVTDTTATTLNGLQSDGYVLGTNPALVDLRVIFFESPTDILLAFEYNQDLFSQALMTQMIGHYHRLIEAIIADSQLPLCEVTYLTEAERDHLLVHLNDTATPFDETLTMHGLFEQQVQKTPQAVAVVDGDRVLSYDELNQTANRLAHHLREAFGVENRARVGVLTERTVHMVVGILAVLKAGGAYVPIEPNQPANRKEYLLTDADVTLLLTDSTYLYEVGDWFSGNLFAVDIQLDSLETPTDNLPPMSGPTDLAYLIYTSGSTGQPKGVMVTHRSNVNMALSQIQTFGIAPTDRVLQFASIGFDASVSEICMALYVGAAIVMISQPTITDAQRFTAFLRTHEVSVVTLPPRYLDLFDVNELPTIRVLITAGEAALPLRGSRSDLRYFNAYGPTECSVCVTIHPVVDHTASDERIPIGQPIANTQVYVLDQHQRLLPQGLPGELYVGGTGLAQGYWQQPELTHQRFVPSPFDPSQRLYRTGDRVRWNAQGELEYLGRLDHQLKIRGFRIEPAEVEAQLLAQPTVAQAACLPHPDGQHLLAFVTALDPASPPDPQHLRQQLAEQLPPYMLPSQVRLVDHWPLTPNGKLNRQTLLTLAQEDQQADADTLEPPAGEAEQRLALVWQAVLGLATVGRHSDFFALGGDSIKAIQIAARLHQQGFQLELKDLFRYPLLRQQAHCLTQRQDTTPASPATPQQWLHHWRQQLHQSNLLGQRTYWLNLVQQARQLPFLPQQPQPGAQHPVAQRTQTWTPAHTQRLLEANAAYTTHTADLLLTALLRTLHCWQPQPAWLLTRQTPQPASLAGLGELLGWQPGAFPLLVQVADDWSVGRWVQEVKEQQRAVPDEGRGYGPLRHLTETGSELALNPPLGFAYQEEDGEPLPGLGTLAEDQWLQVSGQLVDGQLQLHWHYQPAAFAHQLIEYWGQQMERQLEQLIEHCLSQTDTRLTPSDFGDVTLTLEDLERIDVLFN